MLPYYQIATDGGLKENALALTRLRLAPAERTEILIDFSGMQGQIVQLMSYASEFGNGIYGSDSPGMNPSMPYEGYAGNPLNGADFDILELNVTAPTANSVTSIPSTLVTLTPFLVSDSDQSRDFLLRPSQMGFNQLDGDFTINGASMDMNTINVTVPLNNTEIWNISNNSAIAHPFHIHDIQFNIIEYNGSSNVPDYLEGWKDTVLVPNGGGSVKVITKFEDFSDENIPYMYHCHMLRHEDGGMMGQFVVVDATASINNLSIDNDFVLFPNPSDQTYITAKLASDSEKITAYAIINNLGQIITYHKIDKGEVSNMYSFPIFELTSGSYVLKLYSDSKIYTKTFFIK